MLATPCLILGFPLDLGSMILEPRWTLPGGNSIGFASRLAFTMSWTLVRRSADRHIFTSSTAGIIRRVVLPAMMYSTI